MNILEKIIAHKLIEVENSKELYPVKLLEKSIYFSATPVSLRQYLLRPDKVGIVAEIKRQSPSRGVINNHVSVERTSIGYMQAGASALSVLTDNHFFGGCNDDLTTARKFNYCPILRKDFIIDEYQIIEAKSIGADVILLIAAVLTPQRTKELASFAKSLGLEILLEVISKDEITSHVNQFVDIIGVNNRNLTDFTLDVNLSFELESHIPVDFLKVAESAISAPKTIIDLKRAGFNGFLIGEIFMKNSRPEKACADFINEVNKLMDEQFATEHKINS
jgi:indole-3-glycerol phosphate synthase